jgi:adenosylmethionine-8-amino-7-oxononanoate aminotransferase
VLVNNQRLAAHLARRLAPLAGHAQVAEVRQTGLIAAIECVVDRTGRQPWPPEERRGLRVQRYGLEHGVLLRPLGNVIYFMPPFVITPEEIDLMVDVATAAIERACA